MRRNQKGWEELRRKLQNADIPPPYSSWQEFHQSMQNSDSWQYLGRKMRSYEHTPPNYIKQRIFYGGTVVKYSPLPVMLVGLLIGLLTGFLITNKNSLYPLVSYIPDYINYDFENISITNQPSQYAQLVEKNNFSSDKPDQRRRQTSTLNSVNSDGNDVDDHYSALTSDNSYNYPHVGFSQDYTPDRSEDLTKHNDVNNFSNVKPLPPLSLSLTLQDKIQDNLGGLNSGNNMEDRHRSSLPMFVEVHGGINLSRLSALSGSGFSNKALPGWQTTLLIGVPVYRANVLYLALSKHHTRVNINIEGREYYNHIDGTSLEIGGISRTGFVINGKPFYVRYGLMWTQYHDKASEGIVSAGYSPGGILAIRRFNGTLGRRLVWGWEGGVSMLFRDVGRIEGVQMPVNFYISAVLGFKM